MHDTSARFAPEDRAAPATGTSLIVDCGWTAQ
jgi:hypothetical protein